MLPGHVTSAAQGAVAIKNDSIAAVGTTAELLTAGYGDSAETIDCAGMVVMPGLIVRHQSNDAV